MAAFRGGLKIFVEKHTDKVYNNLTERYCIYERTTNEQRKRYFGKTP